MINSLVLNANVIYELSLIAIFNSPLSKKTGQVRVMTSDFSLHFSLMSSG